jgi:hypothetical protein
VPCKSGLARTVTIIIYNPKKIWQILTIASVPL